MLYHQHKMGALFSSFLLPTDQPPRPPPPKARSPQQPPLTLHSLPPEIFHMLSTYLPTSALISLKLTTKHLYTTIPLPFPLNTRSLSRCERNAIKHYTSQARHTRQRRRRCLACGTLQHVRHFRSPKIPICQSEDTLLTSLIPPAWLPGTLRRRLEVLSARMKKGEAVWVEIERVWCAHDRHVVGWHSPMCNCRCESCAHVKVGCYVRVSRKVEVPRSWNFTEDGKGIEEERWLGDSDERVETKRVVPIVTLQEAEEGINVSELSHASLLTLL